MKIGRQILMPAYLRPDQATALKRLAKQEGVAQQQLLREALDALLRRRGALADDSRELLRAVKKTKGRK